MNEITLQSAQLPDNLPDLSRFVLVGREKLNAVRAEIRAIDKVGLAKEVHEQKLKEAQDIADAVLDAEVRIGQLTAALPKATNGGANQYGAKSATVRNEQKSKSEALKEIGIKQDTAERFEQLARHPEAVEKAKAEAREDGRIVTRKNALDTIHDMICEEHKSHRQMKKEFMESIARDHEEFKEKKADDVVSIKELENDRENAEILANELYRECSKIGDQVKTIYTKMTEGEIDLKDMAQHLQPDRLKALRRTLEESRKQIILIIAEVYG